jgi:hypothetical protein
VVTVSGARAYHLKETEFIAIMTGLGHVGNNSILKLDHFKNPLKWFVTLTAAAHTRIYESLHNKTSQAIVCKSYVMQV